MRRSLLLVAVLAASAQTQPGSFDGTARNAVTGEPLARAHVMLVSNAKRYGAISNAEGKFSIAAIEPGAYILWAEHAGFLPLTAGLDVRPGMSVREYKAELTPEGAIVGRVMGPDGAPREGVTVEATKGAYQFRRSTNDRGEFRLDALPPGKYKLKATPPRTTLPPEIRTDGTTEEHFGEAEYAGPLVVGPGAEVSGIEVRLASAAAVRVSGVVTGGSGSGARVEAERPPDPTFTQPAVVTGNAFAIWNLAPGTYLVSARAGTLASATEEVTVGGANVDGIELHLMLPISVTGRIEWDGPPPENQTGLVVELRPPTPRRRTVSLKVELDASLQGPATVSPERYEVAVARGPAGVYVKSLYLGPTEMGDGILDLSRGAGAPVTIRLSAGGGSIAGVVRDGKGPAAGRAVVLTTPGRPRRTETASDGSYAFTGVAPGTYRISVVDGEPENVEVREREKVSKDLKVE